MKALVYHGPGKKSWEVKPKPIIEDPTDAVVKILKTTICRRDLHILKGNVPTVTDGRIIGHEGVGIIDKVGSAVHNFKKGDSVLISCIASCGKCEYCKSARYSLCEKGGWILGNLIDGTQAEYVRIPYADNSLYPIPADADEDALLMLSDILPTGFDCRELNGKVKPGETIAIVGAGPIGLAVLLRAQLYNPVKIIMIDPDDYHLNVAKTFRATHIINSTHENVVEKVKSLTNGKGVDTAIEAVGLPATFELCEAIIGFCGHIANIRIHGKRIILHLQTLWSRNFTITTRLADTGYTPMLFKDVTSRNLDPKKLVTHRFKLNQIVKAYDTLGNTSKEKTLKVILSN